MSAESGDVLRRHIESVACRAKHLSCFRSCYDDDGVFARLEVKRILKNIPCLLDKLLVGCFHFRAGEHSLVQVTATMEPIEEELTADLLASVSYD